MVPTALFAVPRRSLPAVLCIVCSALQALTGDVSAANVAAPLDFAHSYSNHDHQRRMDEIFTAGADSTRAACPAPPPPPPSTSAPALLGNSHPAAGPGEPIGPPIQYALPMPESRAAMAQRHFLQPHNSASPPPHVGEGFLLVVVLVSIVGTLLAVLGAYWRFSRNSIIVVELADGPDTGLEEDILNGPPITPQTKRTRSPSVGSITNQPGSTTRPRIETGPGAAGEGAGLDSGESRGCETAKDGAVDADVGVGLRKLGSREQLGDMEGGASPFATGRAPRQEMRNVLYASLEFVLPRRAAKAQVGGLGKVIGIVMNFLPENVGLCIPTYSDIDYQPDVEDSEGVMVQVEGRFFPLRLWRITTEYTDAPGARVIHLLDCPIFRTRSSDSPYPPDMATVDAAYFYSAWNQGIAAVLQRYNYDIYHTSDFHGALAPLYLLPYTMPLVLTLHNAEYQGNYPLVDASQTKRLQCIFNLPGEVCQEYSWCCGTFNLMWAAVQYLQRVQKGVGASSVSVLYSQRCHQKYDLLWQLPAIVGLPNPMPDEERVKLPEGEVLHEFKAKAKAIVQERFGLEQNPHLTLMVFVGRWSHQKGVDLIADVAEWLVTTHPCQIVVVGPVVDSHGTYAAAKLVPLQQKFPQHMFVHAQYFRVPMELHAATDICLMPSRDEPFGYVDIEFGLYGALCVGFLVGGLGKMPGVYARATSYNRLFLTQQLKNALDNAMRLPQDRWRRMMDAATNAHFPMDLWSRRMDRLYTSASEAHYSGKHTHTFTQTQYSKQLKLDPMAKEPPIHAAAKSFDDGCAPEPLVAPALHRSPSGDDGSCNDSNTLCASDSTESLLDLAARKSGSHSRLSTMSQVSSHGNVRFLTFGIELALTKDGGESEECPGSHAGARTSSDEAGQGSASVAGSASPGNKAYCRPSDVFDISEVSPLMTSIFTKYTQRGSQRWKEYSWEEHVVIAGRAACPSDLPHLVAMQAHETQRTQLETKVPSSAALSHSGNVRKPPGCSAAPVSRPIASERPSVQVAETVLKEGGARLDQGNGVPPACQLDPSLSERSSNGSEFSFKNVPLRTSHAAARLKPLQALPRIDPCPGRPLETREGEVLLKRRLPRSSAESTVSHSSLRYLHQGDGLRHVDHALVPKHASVNAEAPTPHSALQSHPLESASETLPARRRSLRTSTCQTSTNSDAKSTVWVPTDSFPVFGTVTEEWLAGSVDAATASAGLPPNELDELGQEDADQVSQATRNVAHAAAHAECSSLPRLASDSIADRFADPTTDAREGISQASQQRENPTSDAGHLVGQSADRVTPPSPSIIAAAPGQARLRSSSKATGRSARSLLGTTLAGIIPWQVMRASKFEGAPEAGSDARATASERGQSDGPEAAAATDARAGCVTPKEAPIAQRTEADAATDAQLAQSLGALGQTGGSEELDPIVDDEHSPGRTVRGVRSARLPATPLTPPNRFKWLMRQAKLKLTRNSPVGQHADAYKCKPLVRGSYSSHQVASDSAPNPLLVRQRSSACAVATHPLHHDGAEQATDTDREEGVTSGDDAATVSCSSSMSGVRYSLGIGRGPARAHSHGHSRSASQSLSEVHLNLDVNAPGAESTRASDPPCLLHRGEDGDASHSGSHSGAESGTVPLVRSSHSNAATDGSGSLKEARSFPRGSNPSHMRARLGTGGEVENVLNKEVRGGSETVKIDSCTASQGGAAGVGDGKSTPLSPRTHTRTLQHLLSTLSTSGMNDSEATSSPTQASAGAPVPRMMSQTTESSNAGSGAASIGAPGDRNMESGAFLSPDRNSNASLSSLASPPSSAARASNPSPPQPATLPSASILNIANSSAASHNLGSDSIVSLSQQAPLSAQQPSKQSLQEQSFSGEMLVDGDTPEPSMRGLVRVARQPQDKGSDGQQVTRDGAALQVDDIAIEAHASPPEGRRRSSRGGKPPRGRAASPDGERGPKLEGRSRTRSYLGINLLHKFPSLPFKSATASQKGSVRASGSTSERGPLDSGPSQVAPANQTSQQASSHPPQKSHLASVQWTARVSRSGRFRTKTRPNESLHSGVQSRTIREGDETEDGASEALPQVLDTNQSHLTLHRTGLSRSLDWTWQLENEDMEQQQAGPAASREPRARRGSPTWPYPPSHPPREGGPHNSSMRRYPMSPVPERRQHVGSLRRVPSAPLFESRKHASLDGLWRDNVEKATRVSAAPAQEYKPSGLQKQHKSMDEASMQAAAQGGYPVGRVAVLPAVSSKQSLVSSTCTSQSGDNALDKSSTEAKGFNLKALLLPLYAVVVAVAAFVVVYLLATYTAQLSPRCQGRTCAMWQHLPSFVTGLAAAFAALIMALASLLQSNRQKLMGQDAAMDEQFQPLCMQRYALSQLQFNLEKVIVTPVGGTMPFCWHHLLMQLPHLIHVFCLQLLFFQGYIWSLSGGWTMWHGMCTISLFSLASALGVAAWTALTIFLPPCKIAALTCACHAMALSVLPYGTGTYMRTAVTMLTAFATSASVVVSVGVNFLEDVEIDSMSLGPLWSKTSPMFCMRLASFNRFFAVLAASMALPAALFLWGQLSPENAYLATSFVGAASAVVSSLLVLAGSALMTLSPPIYQHTSLSGFRGQLAQVMTRHTVWWCAVSDTFSFSWDCAALLLACWLMHSHLGATLVSAIMFLLVGAACVGYLLVGKAMVKFDCSMQAFIPAAGLLAPPGELVGAVAMLCVQGTVQWSTVKFVLLSFALVWSTILVVWRHQSKSFMVQQVLRREQFILTSGISGCFIGLLQVLGPWLGTSWAAIFGLNLADPADVSLAVFWIVLPMSAVSYFASFHMIHSFTTESLSVP